MGEVISVITSYPKKGEVHSSETVGVASYTKTLLQGVKEQFADLNIKVLAEKIPDREKYIDKGIEVERVWTRGRALSLFRLIPRIGRKPQTVVVSYEAHMVGGILANILLMIILSLLRIKGKRIFIIAHQVPLEMRFLRGVRRGLYLFASRLLYDWMKIIGEIIVFETELAGRVGGIVVPHLIPSVRSKSRSLAREKLGWGNQERIVLYFGYIAPYKGVDWLVDNWSEEIGRLVIAGGINPNHEGNPEIVKYVNQVKKRAKAKSIPVTGLVAEEDIVNYFVAADIVVLPYREFMASSGPLSLAIAYAKPVVMSESLLGYLKSKDIEAALKRSGIDSADLIFGWSESSLRKVIDSAYEKKDKFKEWARIMRERRSVENVSREFIKVIDGAHE